MSDDIFPAVNGRVKNLAGVTAAGWICFLVNPIALTVFAVTSLRLGVGLALHATPLPRDELALVATVPWVIVIASAVALILAYIAKRWALLTLSVVSLLIGLVLTTGNLTG